MKRKSSIRALEAKAKSGDVNASFQLAEYYAQGEYVEQDKEKADFYYERALDNFKNPNLKISSLKLVNFRIFDNDIYFSHPLTVFVGMNGAGKTTILDAIVKSMSWLIILITRQGGKGHLIELADINNDGEFDYASIISRFSVSTNEYSLELSKARDGSNRKRSGQYEEVRQLAELYKLAHSKNDQFNLPIMAFYSVERTVEINKQDTEQSAKKTEKKGWNKFSGYDKSLNGSAEFKLFFNWFKDLEDLNNEKNSGPSPNKDIFNAIEKLQAELNSDFVKEMEKSENLDDKTKEFLSDFKQVKENQIKQLQAGLVEETPTKESKNIDSVTKAIYGFMPGFSNLRIQRSSSPPKMLIDKKGLTLDILQLSQGEKSLFALVADIARRLVLLNPSLSDPLQGNGIVLIDEIDLHLHPGWQQSVIPYLLNTFPNIQFIVTTHSPQVLSTVSAECIRILADGKVYNSSPGTEGAEASRILKRVLGVDVRPPQNQATQELNEYLDLIYADQWTSPRTMELRQKLDARYQGEEPALTEADLYIENRKWELEIEKDQ
ncbi:MAG: retron Ec78 anti-phage system effector ATPase PtuA [Methylovulum miyakonense]|uniref:retron Ec78 anti-phage system effector ATPase PtuA n=1 Tax=Methylovulum miyakonense TaxID=645578 RepID=UPI003BB4C339